MCFLQNGPFCNVLLGFAFPPSHIWQRSFHVSLHQPWGSWPSSLVIYPGSQQSQSWFQLFIYISCFFSPSQLFLVPLLAHLLLPSWFSILQVPILHPVQCNTAKLLQRKSTLNIHRKDWGWGWSSNTLTTWWEEPTHWKRPWCCERLRARGEGGDRGWGGWMASSSQWTWVWGNSRR